MKTRKRVNTRTVQAGKLKIGLIINLFVFYVSAISGKWFSLRSLAAPRPVVAQQVFTLGAILFDPSLSLSLERQSREPTSPGWWRSSGRRVAENFQLVAADPSRTCVLLDGTLATHSYRKINMAIMSSDLVHNESRFSTTKWIIGNSVDTTLQRRGRRKGTNAASSNFVRREKSWKNRRWWILTEKRNYLEV